jgi:hypothetical protein
VSSEDDFDLLAASLRADAGDVHAFVEALATKLEGAFPERVRVERKGGLLGGRRRVERVSVAMDDQRFELERAGGDVGCRRSSMVRGIALKSEQLPLERWIEELSRALSETAHATEHGRAALQRLLEG